MLWEIEPYASQGLPINSIFHKGRCGIGGTTLEINQDRHSIIVVPTTPPIEGKCNDENGILAVMGEEGLNRAAKVQKIINELQSGNPKIKIMTTPDSFECIIDAAIAINKLQWLYDEFFLLLDECHSFVTEAFRRKITIPFRYMWNFKAKCLISATPIRFSDPRFAELEEHEIIINEKLGTIELIETSDINGTIHFLLTHPEKFPANVHIFYNSVTQLSKDVTQAFHKLGDLDCNIFCSNNDENLKKLGEVSGMFRAKPEDDRYKKFNIYTTRYFEAWDLRDPNATIILITDVNASHTKVGITNKGFQAIGRLRNEANRIIHFTNHSNKQYRRDLSYFQNKHKLYAIDILKGYSIHAENCEKIGLSPYGKFKDAAENYSEISKDGYIAKLEIIRIDQLANHDSCNEEYNNITFIKEAWESSNYNVIIRKVIEDSIPNLSRLNIQEQLSLAFKRIQDLEDNKENMLFEGDYETSILEIQVLNRNFELAFKAYHLLGMEKVNSIGFDRAKLENEIYDHLEGKIRSKVNDELSLILGESKYYNNAEVKKMLQHIYHKVEYRARNGKIKTAVATHIMDFDCISEPDKYGYTIAASQAKKLIN